MMYRGIRIEERKGYLFIEKQWSKANVKTFSFAAIFFIALAIFASFQFDGSSSIDLQDKIYIIGLFLSLGLFFVYIACAHIWNTTKIRINDGTLNVNYSPVLFPPKQFSVNDIRKIYIREQSKRFGKGYSLWLSLYNKEEVLLVDKFVAEHDARDVEQAIERYLVIDNEQGEYQ